MDGHSVFSRSERNDLIMNMKKNTTIESLCQGLHEEFGMYIQYCQSLSSEADPDYAYARDLFKNLFRRMGFQNDGVFDWDLAGHPPEPIGRPLVRSSSCGALRAGGLPVDAKFARQRRHGDQVTTQAYEYLIGVAARADVVLPHLNAAKEANALEKRRRMKGCSIGRDQSFGLDLVPV